MLDKLRVPVVDVYGDSYGSYFAQAFAVRHRERVRAVVLDGAFPVAGFDPWARQESVALRFAWPETCRRSNGCGGVDALAELRRWSLRLAAKPLVATGRDADGGRHRIRLDGASLGQMAGDGSFYYTIYRDLLAALRAYERGDRAPLLRLAAEDLPYTGGGPVKSYSEGAYAAVACHDYPTIWNPAATGRRAARAARSRPGADRPGRLRSVPEEPVAALALHRPARDRLPRVAGAAVPGSAGSGGRDLSGHAGARAQRRP